MGPSRETLRRALTLDVMTAPDPVDRLRRHLEALERRQDLETQAAVFESLIWQIDVGDFWIWHRMRQVYADLGRRDAAFLMAAFTVRKDPTSEHLRVPFREMFTHFRDRQLAQPAVDVFLRHATREPTRPIADRWEIDPLTRSLGISLDGTPRPVTAGSRLNRTVFPADNRPAMPVRQVGPRPLPPELLRLREPVSRAAVVVAELPDAELLLADDMMVTVDRDGNVQIDLSLGPFPALIRDAIDARRDVPVRDIDEAVVALDPHPPPNLSHFLLDHLGRLAFYQAAGVVLDRCWVIGPTLREPYQQAAAAQVATGPWLSAKTPQRLRIRRLWVSDECREVQHPGHLGAPMVIDWVRRLLRAPNTRGRRRLYVSRADAQMRQVRNEDALRALLARHGFDTIMPGQMSYEAQLEAFRDASHVVGAHGAALAHLAACGPGTRVLELFHPLYGTWAYAILAQASGLDYAGLAGQDGVSDLPELNDAAVVGPTQGRYGHRDMRIDPDLVAEWLASDS